MRRKIIGEDEVRSVLSMFKVLSKEQLNIYLGKVLKNTTTYGTEAILHQLVITKKIFESEKGYYSFEEIPKLSYISVNAFWVFLELIGDEIPIIDKARYPSDYIFLANKKVYEMIIFNDDGNQKLNYYNHKFRNDEMVTPVLVLINRTIHDIDKNCLPQFDYLKASVTTNENGDNPEIKLEEIKYKEKP